jgi:hypothetical protein
VNKIKRWWNTVSGRLSADGTQTEDMTARELCRMLQRCPVCHGEFNGHHYAHFAVTILGEDRRGRVREFFDAVEDWDWEEAQKFQEFDPKRDAVVAYVVKCSGGRMAVLLERSPFEHYETDRLIACDMIDEESGRELDGMIARNDWRRL